MGRAASAWQAHLHLLALILILLLCFSTRGSLGVFVWEPWRPEQAAEQLEEGTSLELREPSRIGIGRGDYDSEWPASGDDGGVMIAKRFKPEFACNCAFEVRCRSDTYCRRKHSPAHRCLLNCCGLRCSDAHPE